MDNVPYRLMQGLYYPAIIGTGLVVTLLRIGELKIDNAIISTQIWFGFYLILYFSLSFLANTRMGKKYNWILFILDTIEIVAMLAAFYFLGLFTPQGQIVDRWFYFSLAIAPALHLVWNKVAYTRVRNIFIVMSLLRLSILLIGVIIGDLWLWYRLIVLVTLFIVSIVYCRIKYKANDL